MKIEGCNSTLSCILKCIRFLEVMTSKKIIMSNFNDLEKMGIRWIDPWEKPLHDLYKNVPCLSPLPSLAVHCANINSVFGVSPSIDIKKLWDDNK